MIQLCVSAEHKSKEVTQAVGDPKRLVVFVKRVHGKDTKAIAGWTHREYGRDIKSTGLPGNTGQTYMVQEQLIKLMPSNVLSEILIYERELRET